MRPAAQGSRGMSSDTLKTRAIIVEANEWLIKMMEPGASAADEAGFAAWLRQSPVHVREYLRAEAVYAAMAGIDPERRIDVGDLLRQDGGNVVELGQVRQVSEGCASEGAVVSQEAEDWSSVPDSRAGVLDQQGTYGDLSQGSGPRSRSRLRKGGRRLQRARSPRRLWTAAACMVLAIAAGAALYIQNTAPDVYTTALGEQRRLVLEDGSVIEMNTQSELEVHFAEDQRSVKLVAGEALFEVAKDVNRPFQVMTDSAVIEAVGTAFNVRSVTEEVTVTVVEGIVDVTSRSSRPRGGQVGRVDGEDEAAPAPGVLEPVRLKVGQQARIESTSGQVAVIDTTVEKAVAWQERRLIFENQPLSEVVAEFNRYNRRQLVIQDTNLANTRISAVFDADQPEALVRFLTQNTPIEVVDESDSPLVLRADE